MLSKWLAKQNRHRHSNTEMPIRLWTATTLGRSILAAEQKALAACLPNLENQTVIELAWLELPATGMSESIAWRAATSTWQSPAQCSLEMLPLISRSVDVVIWRYLGLEWRSRRRLLADIARVLVPGGSLVSVALNPLDARIWRLAGIAGIGLQAAGGINSIARAVGLQMMHKSWHGSGLWRFRPLQISVLNKRQVGGVSQPYIRRTRRRVAQPAVALSRTGGLS